MTDNEKALRELRDAIEKVFCTKACFTKIRLLRYLVDSINGVRLLFKTDEKENEYREVYKIIKEYKESVTNTGSESIEIAENLRTIRAIYKAEMSARPVSTAIACGVIAGVIALVGIFFSLNKVSTESEECKITMCMFLFLFFMFALLMILLLMISNFKQIKASIIVSVIQDIMENEEEKHKHNKEPVKVEITMKK